MRSTKVFQKALAIAGSPPIRPMVFQVKTTQYQPLTISPQRVIGSGGGLVGGVGGTGLVESVGEVSDEFAATGESGS